ncbi:MAG: DUF2156 domain-containing protein [Wolinella sp.]
MWKPLDIEDREIFERYFIYADSPISDFSFTNLYLWHFSRSISYAIINDCLCIKTQYHGENPFLFFPLGNGDKKAALGHVMECFESRAIPFSMRSLSKEAKDELENMMPGKFEIIHNRDRSDYVYLVEELIELKGRKFHKKKNHLNRFFELHPDFTYESLGHENVSELLEAWKLWFGRTVDEANDGLKNEYIGIVETLKHFNEMSYKGGILRVDGKIIAFTLGEQLNSDTVVIHIEKADTEYHGAYQAINQQFLAHEWSALKYVNREEDLGIEGLRRAKLSYQPCHLVDKYNATLIS